MTPACSVHLEVVRLFRTPDPANEEYQSDTPPPRDTPFGSPEPFLMLAIDVTAGDTPAHAIASTAIVGGESGYLPAPRTSIARSSTTSAARAPSRR
jgi:hypothetical protein